MDGLKMGLIHVFYLQVTIWQSKGWMEIKISLLNVVYKLSL